MKTILKYMKPYRVQGVLSPIFKLVEALLELSIPLIVKNIIDLGILKKDMTTTVKLSLALVVISLLGYAFSITAQYFAAYSATYMARDLRSDLFRKVLNLSSTDYDSEGPSTLVTRLTQDVNLIFSGVNMILRLVLRSPFITFGSLICAFSISKKAGIIFSCVIPALLVAVVFISGRTVPMYKNIQKKVDILLLKVRENLKGIRIIRAFGTEKKEVTDFEECNEDYANYAYRTNKISAYLGPVTFLIVNLGIIALMWNGALDVNRGGLSSGSIVALYNYMAQILIELVKLANLVALINKFLAASSRVDAVFKKSEEDKSGVALNDFDRIDCSQVAFRYNGSGADVITDFNLSCDFKRDKFIGIYGTTGSGKTTVINLLQNFYRVTSGEITFNGVNINNISKEWLNENVGVVPQKSNLFEETVYNNLTFGRNADEEHINYCLEASCCKKVIDNLKDGLESKVSANGANFSGGEKQRLCIARALVRKPKLLLLDDSLSALDADTTENVLHNLMNLSWKPLIIMVSSRPELLSLADKKVDLSKEGDC